MAPAYSITAHGSQGQTLPAAIIDLQIGRGVSARASYVAITRIRTRNDLLIFRNFDKEVFTQGDPEGPALLLRVLRARKSTGPRSMRSIHRSGNAQGPA